MKLTHPLLVKVAQAQIDRVPQQLRGALERATMAANKLLYAKETRKVMMQQMDGEGDIGELVGEGAAKLMIVLWTDSQGKLPLRVLIPAGVILTCQALEFIMESGAIEDVDNALVDTAVQEYASSILQLMGATPEQVQALVEQAAAKQGGPAGPAVPPQGEQQGAAAPQGGIIAAQQGV